MATYLFAWNPSLVFKWPELAADVRRVARRGHLDTHWNSRTRMIEPGSRAFLVRVGVEPRGLFGAGYVLTAPIPGPHWMPEKAARGVLSHRLDLRIDQLFEVPPLTYADLAVPPFSRFRWGVRSSGTRVPSTLADALEVLWEKHVAAHGAKTKAVPAARSARSRTARKPSSTPTRTKPAAKPAGRT